MSKLDRKLQREILEDLREAYPEVVSVNTGGGQDEAAAFKYNLMYLIEHGLCAAEILRAPGMPVSIKYARITAKGIDFLEADGGLTVTLGGAAKS